MNRPALIVPLDVPHLDAARRVLDRLSPLIGAFKIGKQLFTAAGPSAVELVHGYGKRVFLDLKFHDIPNTVAAAVEAAADLGVWMLNLHVAGGRSMLEAAREARDRRSGEGPLLLGVTVLTSLDEGAWRELFGEGAMRIDEQVVRFARLAQDSGLDGVIASPKEIAGIRRACGPRFRIVTPGVRPEGASLDDQKRTMTPAEAMAAGADHLVIGRPITAAPDSLQAADRIRAEIDEARRSGSVR